MDSKLVLIVDDSDVDRELVRRHLAGSPYEGDFAATFEEGLATW